MADLALVPDPPRAQLLRQLRQRLTGLVPELHVVAEGVLGADSRIDFLGIEPAGRVVAVLVGEPGGDLEGVGRAVAQRAWLEPRLRDWLQLAPELGIRPQAGARVLLLCPDFRPETLAAAQALGPDALSLARYRCLRNGAGLETLLEAVGGAALPAPPRGPAAEPEPAPVELAPDPGPAPEPTPGPGLSPFRTGLSDADLDLSAEERAEFE